MAIRTACVILVFVVPGPARWVFAVGAVFLPYVAVILANTQRSRRDGPPPTVGLHAQVRAGLDAGPAATSMPRAGAGTPVTPPPADAQPGPRRTVA